MEINKLLPNLCKHESCLQKADYEFTDIDGNSLVEVDGLVSESLSNEVNTIVIGHACNNHVTEVHKMLKEIYGDKSG